MRIRSALILLVFLLVVSCVAAPAYATPSVIVRPAESYGSISGGDQGACGTNQAYMDSRVLPSDAVDSQKGFYHPSTGSCYGRAYYCPSTYVYVGQPFYFSYATWVYDTNHVVTSSSTCTYMPDPPPPPQCEIPKGNSVTLQLHDVMYPETTCYHKCLMNDAGIGFQISNTYYGDFVSTGELCSADSSTNGGSNSEVDPAYANSCSDGIQIEGFCYTAKPDDCPKGTVWGTYNGRGVCATKGKDDNSPKPAPDAPGTTGGQTPGANTGTCPASDLDCGIGSGSSPGYCDPSLDASCVADGGQDAGGKDTGTCPADQPDCGATSGSAPGKCDPKTDSACSPGSSVSGGTCTKETILPPSCSSKDETDCSVVISTWYSRCYASLIHDSKLDLPDVSHWGDMSKVGLSNCDTIAACNASFYDALKAAPVSQAFANFSTIIPSGGGECPPLSIDLSSMGWGTISSNIICDSLNGAAGTFLGSLFMLIYLVVAFRVFASS